VLMCPTHHTVIDDDEDAYTVEHLIKIKALHEARSATNPESEASVEADLLVQSLTNVAQSGGFAANNVSNSNITVQGAPSTSQLTRQRQIQAIENLWRIIRNLSSEFSMIVFVDNILTDQELGAYFKGEEHSHIAGSLREFADMNATLGKLQKAGANDAAKERPFVTNRVWSIFGILQAIYGRTALLITNSYKGRELNDWRKDSGCDQLLRSILPAHAVDHVKAQHFGGIRAAIEQLESQFLAEAGMNQP
jgi:hypothetical protein